MLEKIKVTKRDGAEEPFSIDKLHKLINFSCTGLQNVSPSAIAIGVRKNLNGAKKISSKDLVKLIIKSAQDLITEHTPNYQYVAGRMTSYNLRKEVYGSVEVPSLKDIVYKNVEEGWYDKEILDYYTDEELDILDSHLDHNRDEHFTIAAWKQLLSKYLVRNRVTKEYKETPQIMYMLIAMILFKDSENKLKDVVDFYNSISKGSKSTIGLPTPILAGIRTPTRQFSSCVVGKCGDSLDSITATSEMIVKYAAKRAGIGVDVSAIRPIGSPIRGGEVVATGITPFVKLIQAATKSSSQGGVRSGSSTAYYPIFHYEIETILPYKNNKGTEDNRVRHIDHAIAINEHFYKKVIANEDYYLFDHTTTPGLYDAFYNNSEEFEKLYNKYSKKQNVRKKKVNARDLFLFLVSERAQTGRVYVVNIDNMNSQKLFKEPIYSSNLCLEIALPTADLTSAGNLTTDMANQYGVLTDEHMNNPDLFRETFGEVALCTLSNINWGIIRKPEDFEQPCRLAVRALDSLLDYQDYPLVAAEIPAKARRNLGIGVNNFAYWLAKNKLKYGEEETLKMVDEYMEAMYYYLVKASIELAKEKGACTWFGSLDHEKPFIWMKRHKNIDDLVEFKLRYDWDALLEEYKKYGIRHSTLVATMPSESNSLVINATNGIEPIRDKVITKGNKTDTYKQVVPNLNLKYEILWDIDPEDYLKTVAVLQKWTDQSISSNTSYDPQKYGGKIPAGKLMKDILTSQKYGIKTLYYHNTKVTGDEMDEDNCESCKL